MAEFGASGLAEQGEENIMQLGNVHVGYVTIGTYGVHTKSN